MNQQTLSRDFLFISVRANLKFSSKLISNYVLKIEFEDGLNQRLGTATEQERNEWVQFLRMAGYDLMRAQLQYLREQIEKRHTSHRMDIDVDMHRLQTGNSIGDDDDLIKF